MKRILLLFLLAWIAGSSLAQTGNGFPVQGKVIQLSDGLPFPGVNVLVKGTTLGTVTDEEGKFVLNLPKGTHTLLISFIGYISQEFTLEVPLRQEVLVQLKEDAYSLSEVMVFSTGFQEIPAERATGSFVGIDQKLFNRRVSTNLLDRLEDVTPGLIFNRDRTDLPLGESISIRGNSTIQADRNPLIVVDNMIYDGPIENINPNDVESITVLRDAAAASIWGAKAGNGVLVIRTKSGQLARPMQVNFTANITQGRAFDPFYLPQMPVSDFVDVEQRLFKEGYYEFLYESFDNQAVSPLVEDLYAHRKGKLTDSELAGRIEGYRNADVRNDLRHYLYRPSLYQQYAVNLNGGTSGYSYFFSLGYDQNQETRVAQSRDRFTLNGRQKWRVLKSKGEVELGTYLISNQSKNGFPDIGSLYPYDRLVDAEGNPAAVIRDHNPRFKQNAMDRGVLDWNYRPLEEIGLSPLKRNDFETRVNFRLAYRFTPDIQLESNYQFWNQNGNQEQVFAQNSYFSRNQVNLFSQLRQGQSPLFVLPRGGIRDLANSSSQSHTWRNQLSFNKTVNEVHSITALAGIEVKDFNSEINQNRFYGYDPETGISEAVDYLGFYPRLNTGFNTQIPFVQGVSGNTDRFVSVFANSGYTYRDRYTFTVSARSDASNLYGVETNQRRVPLWSTGIGWTLSEEDGLTASWVDFLKLKASYGFTGNTNPAATAFTTGVLFPANTNSLVGTSWMSLLNPPNPALRWEKIKIINAGLEWDLWKGRVMGSFEAYRKEGIDLFGIQPYFPSSGNLTVTRNYANTLTNGFDLSITGRIIQRGVSWSSTWFHSLVKEEVTRYSNVPNPQNVAFYSSGREGLIPEPVEGYPLYSIFSFASAGLDPTNGNPRGFLDGEPSSNYQAILNRTTLEDLVFHGSAIPTQFGAWRNQLNWKNWELSANLTYRLGYYFRRESVSYISLNRGAITHSDYTERWQKPGDELTTDIPSDPLTVNQTRSTFELVNSSRIRKGDHIRFQDIQLAYSFSKGADSKLPFESLRIYGYANNLGILWKAAKDVRDPDFRTIQALPSYSLGLSIQF